MPEQRAAAIATMQQVVERELWEINTDAYHERLRAAWAILQDELATHTPAITRLEQMCQHRAGLHATLGKNIDLADTERIQQEITDLDAQIRVEMGWPDYTRHNALCMEQRALHKELRRLQSPELAELRRTEWDIRGVQAAIVGKDAEIMAELDRIGV